MKIPILLLLQMVSFLVVAQNESFEVLTSSDTILLGNSFQIKFEAKNISGTIESPNLFELNVISGPNQSTSVQMINGATTQSSSYTYTVKPEEIGAYVIEPAYISDGTNTFETTIREVIVIPNPNGIIENSSFSNQQFFEFDDFNFDFGFPEQLKKPKQPKKDTTPKRVLKRI